MVTKNESILNINNDLFNLINNALGKTLPPNVVRLELILELNALPIIKAEFYPEKVTNSEMIEYTQQQFRIEKYEP